MSNFTDKPCAMAPLLSYRYKSRYGWVMIGARDDKDALNEAQRSVSDAVSFDALERWNGTQYVHCEAL